MDSFILCKNEKCKFPVGDIDIHGSITIYNNATIRNDENRTIRCKHCNIVLISEKPKEGVKSE